MQCGFDARIPDGLLAANTLLAENSRQGFGASTHTLHQGFGVVISNTSLGISGSLYDEGVESRYTGKERDSESGLDYFGARYYGSSMGRFMSPDPSALDFADPTNPQSLNLYSYVLNNPLIYTDPDGLDCVYTSNQTSGSVSVETVRGDCRSDTDSGVYVDGHVDTDSYKYTQSNGNYSLNYNYTPDSGSGGDGSGGSQSGSATLGVGKIGLDSDPPSPENFNIQQLAQGITADSQHSFGCIGQAYGLNLGGAGETARYMGQPVANTKPFITPGTSLGTSPLSEYARGAPRISGRFRAPVGGPGTGTAFRMARTGSLGVAAARYAPFVGLALDAISVGQLANCLGH